MLQADGLAAVFAQLWAHEVERAAAVTQSFAGSERVYLDRRTAVFTVRAQVVESFKPAAFALPVTDLILDEVESGGAAEVWNRKHRLKHRLQTRTLALFRQHAHLHEPVIRFPL